MREWFMSDPLRAVLLIVAVPSTLIMLIQTILIFVGMAGGDADMDIPDDNGIDGVFGHNSPEAHDMDIGDSGLRLFTVRGMVAFFSVGGWAGLSAYSLTDNTFAAIITAVIFGSLALLLVAWFFKWAASLHANGMLNMDSAVGKIGEVYITIPANMSGTGKVNVVIQERLTEAEAVTECDRPLKFGERVRVTGVTMGSTLIVEQISDKKVI